MCCCASIRRSARRLKCLPSDPARSAAHDAQICGAHRQPRRSPARHELLCEKLMIDLAARGVGARRLDMVFQRVDNVAQAIRIGTSKPNRDTKHLTKLLAERLVLVEPGFGIEEATLTASWIEALTERQTVGAHVAEAGSEVDVSQLVDTLRVRLGNERVFRLSPVESDIPERSARRVAATSRADGATWPKDLPRPARLLSPPEQVQAIAEIPDGPPRLFVWRKVRHRVARADGPERILGEWWLSDQDIGLQRDYYRVETEAGSASGSFATRLRSRAAAGGCTGSVKHELRRASGHESFLIPARRVERGGVVRDSRNARHQGARGCRPQLSCRHCPRLRSVATLRACA